MVSHQTIGPEWLSHSSELLVDIFFQNLALLSKSQSDNDSTLKHYTIYDPELWHCQTACFHSHTFIAASCSADSNKLAIFWHCFFTLVIDCVDPL